MNDLENILPCEEKQEEIVSEEETILIEEEISNNTTEEEEVEEIYLDEVLEDINKKLENLASAFDEKIRFDEYKNEMFDNMHKELTSYRNEESEKNINSMALDIIQLMDSYRKLLTKFDTAEASEENYKRLKNNFYGILEDLTDVLYRQSIEEYSVENDDVDVKKQKIISTISTEDETLNNKIAERLAPGYEKNNKILRPERISIYKYTKKGE